MFIAEPRLSVLRGADTSNASLSAFLRTMCSTFMPPALSLVVDKLHITGDRDDFTEQMRVELFFGDQKEVARLATSAGKEESYLQTRSIEAKELSKPSSAKGWAGPDYFGVDILPEAGAWRLTPPFRNGLRFGAPLRIRVLSEQSHRPGKGKYDPRSLSKFLVLSLRLIASGQVDWNDLLDSYADHRPSGFTVQVGPASGRDGRSASANFGVEFALAAKVDLVDADGDAVGAVCMRPNFKSETLDVAGLTAMEPQDNWFQDDVPGDIYQQGVDRFVNWTSERCDDDKAPLDLH